MLLFKIIGRYFFCLMITVGFCFPFVKATGVHADDKKDDGYIRTSNQRVWAIIYGNVAPTANSYSAAQTRKINQQLTNLKTSPIDFKKKKFGIKEAYSPLGTSVAGRGEDMTRRPKGKGGESSTSFYGNAAKKILPKHARVKKSRIAEIRRSNLMIQQLIQQADN